MIKLHVLGSCSGTEPYPGRHQTSIALELQDRLYFLDAGENCAFTAHTMGLDLLRTREIFISHTHMDHIGGLGHLLWNIRKLAGVKKRQPDAADIGVLIPDTAIFDAQMALLRGTEGNFATSFTVSAKQTADGVVYDDGVLKAEALHNTHLKHEEGDPWRSFSYLIAAEGKRIVFSGDVGGVWELTPFLEGGCDVLMMETGHHDPRSVAAWLKEHPYKIGALLFVHHGRWFLDRYAEMRRDLDRDCPLPYLVAEDAMTLTL